jgi:hypothetical protein
MQPHSVFWHYLWIAPHVLQIALAIVMFRRKLHRDFPWFLTYTIYQVVVNAADVETLFSIFLRFAVIYEIFRVLLRPYQALQRVSSALGNAVLVVLLGGALIVAAYGPVPDYTTRLISMSVSMDRVASLVQCGLLLFLFVFSHFLRISWRGFAFGVASGFAFYLAVQLVMSALLARFYIHSANTIDMACYHCSVLIWLGYALAPQRVPVATKSIPSHQLESWNVELERLLQR